MFNYWLRLISQYQHFRRVEIICQELCQMFQTIRALVIPHVRNLLPLLVSLLILLFLCIRRLSLMLIFPLLIGHAVDNLTRRIEVEINISLRGLCRIPLRQTVTAKSRKVHQINVLHIIALSQV